MQIFLWFKYIAGLDFFIFVYYSAIQSKAIAICSKNNFSEQLSLKSVLSIPWYETK